MIPTAGRVMLVLALVVALLQSVLLLVGAQRGHARWMAAARPLTVLHGALLAGAFGALVACLVASDFSVLYVAAHSNTQLPLAYRVAAAWGGHAGSLLLWATLLAGWMVAVAATGHRLPPAFTARALGVLAAVSAGFLTYVLALSDPFTRLLPPVREGRDLNPLLQDPGMVLHPPLLYLGYVGFSVAYAFALAALLGRQVDAAWARWSRPWTLAAWTCLTLGIALGSLWAYHELGWGGWWFWDPVENAALMPWLAGTALLHSLAVTEKRGSFKAWTLLLALLTFALSLMGTFLVRSGVLSSVHAFATDPRRGLAILVFLALAVGASLAIYAARARGLGWGQRSATLSKETGLLVNNALLLAATGAVLLGTLYPLALDALGLGTLSVGPPYFDSVFRAMLAPLLFVLGAGPLLHWKADAWPAFARRLRGGVATVALTLVGLTAWTLARDGSAASPMTAWSWAGVVLAAWVASGVATDAWAWRRQWTRVGRARVGMWLAHLGIAVFVAGVSTVRTHELALDVHMAPGDSAALGDFTFRFDGVQRAPGPNYVALRANVHVSRDRAAWATLAPEKRLYRVQRAPMTEAAVHRTLARDVYVSLGEPQGQGRWTLRLQVKPLMAWVWLGCGLMALGGGIAASDRRYRTRAGAEGAQPGAEGTGPLSGRPPSDASPSRAHGGSVDVAAQFHPFVDAATSPHSPHREMPSALQEGTP